MKKSIKNVSIKFLRITLLLLFITFSIKINAQQDTEKQQDAKDIKEEHVEDLPSLSEIIPEVTLLSDELTVLNNSIGDLVDVKDINEKNKKITVRLKAISTEFNDLKKEGNVGTNELDNLKNELNQSGQQFDESNKTLKSAIELLEKSREEWLGYKKKWGDYDSLLSSEDLPAEAKKALSTSSLTIGKGLDVISSKLNVLMKLQQSGYTNQSVINDLDNQILVLKQKKIASAFEDGSIPIYSPKFYEQFNSKLWPNVKRGFKNVILPNSSYFESNWWIYFLQIFITSIIVYLIRKNSEFIKNNTKYEYIAERSISAGIFFGFLFVVIFHNNMKNAPLINLILFLVGGYAFCRLISNRKIEAWKNRFYYILVAILGLTGVFHVFNLPIVLFRLFITTISLFGIYRLYLWNKRYKKKSNSKGYNWLFLGLFIYLWIIVISEFIGKEVLALYMYDSLLKSCTLIVFSVAFLKMIEAGIEVGLKMISNGNENNIDDDNDDSDGNSATLISKTVKHVSTFIGVLILLFGVLPRLLVFWNIYNDIPEAHEAVIGVGFTISDVKISLGVMIISISILYGSYIASTVIQMILMNDRFDEKLDKGTRMSIAQLIRYFLIFFGFLIAIGSLGYNLTNFAIVLSALGVGIGFGLQGVVNNFVSGLILLFERPIREGDTIEMDGNWSDVKKIGLRSTRVQTFDQSYIIIPNADLIYNKVTNWTLNHNRKRVTVSVGVAYGSDIVMVMNILKDIGSTAEGIVKNVNAEVLFRDFGDSTLNFDLRVRAKNVLAALGLESDIRKEIDKRFRENNIEIAFPQRDLHIRSVDNEITVKTLTNVAPKVVLKADPKEVSKPVSKATPKEVSKVAPKPASKATPKSPPKK